jgi:alkanesulfonate monooxygenase SsuD/methylene tetrahydromethanopterin reductase-like flavin-dependent oxidoreductase (luciferase family)
MGQAGEAIGHHHPGAGGIMRYGLVVPHFGPFATRSRLAEGARAADRLGFDSLWVRDHVVFEPHGMEGSDPTFVDPFITLAYLSGVTDSIGFGTATLIPFRHPLHFAGSVGSLSWVGERSLDLGVGAGGFAHEFELLGMDGVDRADLMREHVRIARALWDGGLEAYRSERYEFRPVTIEPRPSQTPTLWFGGASPRAARMAAEFCDGWLPGRITFPTFKLRREKIAASRVELGRPMIRTGAMPLVSVDTSRERALERINVQGLLAGANRFWVQPASGRFETIDDLSGVVIAGNGDDILEGVERYRELGAELLILDLRFRFDDWVEQVERLADILSVGKREPGA